MAADLLRCPACSGALSKPGQSRCEWCGAALPAAAKAAVPVGAPARADLPRDGERDRLAAVLEQMQAHPPAAARSHGAGCLFFVLLLLAIAFVVFFMATPRTIAPSATPATESPAPAPADVERADPKRGQ